VRRLEVNVVLSHLGRAALFVRVVVVATILGCATLAAPASAAVVTLQSGVLKYEGQTNDANVVTISRVENTDKTEYKFTEQQVLISRECDNSPTTRATSVMCPAQGVREIQVALGNRDDTLTIDATVAASGSAPDVPQIFVDGGTGRDVLNGGDGPETLVGGPGDDTLNGGGGNDRLDFPVDRFAGEDQTGGTDTLDGGPGNDRLNGGPPGAPAPETLIGSDGVDTADYSQRTAPLAISLDDVRNDGEAGENADVQSTVENVIGGSESDALIGSAAPNVLNGADGDDRVVGLDGDDMLDGGTNTPGSDTLDGGDGVDCLYGRAGDDRLVGGPGPDCLFGAGGSDALEGDGGDDTLAGGAGPDALEGDDGDDSLDGSEANLVGADGPDTLDGGAGADSLSGAEGDDRLDGGTGPDPMKGGPGRDTVTYEDRARDVIVTLNGRPDDGEEGEGDNVAADVEVVIGGTLDDTLTGDRDANALTSGAGQDLVNGGAGRDRLVAGDAPDVVQARDGERDIVDCGDDGDLAIVDSRDTVRNCATVDRGRRRRAVFGRAAVVRPARSEFGLELPDGNRRFALDGPVKIPIGSTIDPRKGVRLVTAANGAGERLDISISRGPVQLRQDAAQPAVTQLRLRVGPPAACARARGRARAAVPGREVYVAIRQRPRRRKPPPHHPGPQVEMAGEHSIAIADGTRWLTVERCDGTLTRVDSGVVRVRDFERHTTVLVRAGHRYLARAR
jgi:Ca2+-binding RTX toxin-like protein